MQYLNMLLALKGAKGAYGVLVFREHLGISRYQVFKLFGALVFRLGFFRLLALKHLALLCVQAAGICMNVLVFKFIGVLDQAFDITLALQHLRHTGVCDALVLQYLGIKYQHLCFQVLVYCSTEVLDVCAYIYIGIYVLAFKCLGL